MTSELETAGLRQRGPAIPLAVKLVYTAWTVVWLTVYWQQYGPSTLLWLCDFANLATLAAIWLESPLLLSSQLVAVAVPQVGWTIDWLGRLLLGFHPIGGTEYMFDEAKPWWLRALSLFHLWMLPLLVWLVRRTGYDRRGVWVQSALMGAVLLPLSWLVAAREENFNWVWGLFGKEQTWMPAGAWFACLLVLYPLVLFLPAHWLASKTLARVAAKTLPARRPRSPEASHASAQRAADAAGIPELTRPTARS